MAPASNEADPPSRKALIALVAGSMVRHPRMARGIPTEASMKIRTVTSALILAGLVAVVAPSPPVVAQPKDSGATAPNQAGAAASKEATPNTNTNPTKHRYWRHRGGKHPHYGSRRVGT
jgi:hypothetical protein